MNRNLTIILTHTATRFGTVIRMVTQKHYNHISISLDDDLKKVYSFSRRAYETPIDGSFVSETAASFTLGKLDNIDAKIYKVPLSEEQYQLISGLVETVSNDEEYTYNLLSAISYPLLGGFATYKSFTCSEFAAWLLIMAGYPLNKDASQYLPEDLTDEISQYLVYEGNLLDYGRFQELNTDDNGFFKEMPIIKIITVQASALVEQMKRLLKKEGD